MQQPITIIDKLEIGSMTNLKKLYIWIKFWVSFFFIIFVNARWFTEPFRTSTHHCDKLPNLTWLDPLQRVRQAAAVHSLASTRWWFTLRVFPDRGVTAIYGGVLVFHLASRYTATCRNGCRITHGCIPYFSNRNTYTTINVLPHWECSVKLWSGTTYTQKREKLSSREGKGRYKKMSGVVW